MLIVGTLCTLAAFQTNWRRLASRPKGCAFPIRAVGRVCRWFLVAGLGAVFAGAVSTSLTVFIGRVQYLAGAIGGLFR
jgi:hypothetical protein